MQEINENLLRYLHSFMEIELIWILAPKMADLPIFILPVFLLAMRFYYNHRGNKEGKRWVIMIFMSCVLWITISLMIQQFVDIERPEAALAWSTNLIMNHIPDASFPSDHATVSIAFLYAVYLFWYTKFFYIILIPMILMNISRIIVWVHWPLDIIAWSLVWIVSAIIIHKNKNKFFLDKLSALAIKIMSYFKL